MANDNTVNVEITASVEGLKSGLKQAESGIKGFSTETDKMVSKTNKMADTVKVNAVPAMTSFSQVIQDAPYGIRGVANNIQQLTSQFGYLSARTGGAGGAIKAMISSLSGPAGMLFAVSAITSLLVSYGDELFKTSKEVDNNTLANQRLNDALRAQLELRKLLKDELSLATKIAVAEAKLAGKSAEEQFKISQTYEKARILTLEQQVNEAKKLRFQAAADAKLAKNQENEDIQDLAKKAYKDQLELEKTLKDAKAELRLAELNELIRIQEQNKKATKVFYGELKQIVTTAKSDLQPITNALNQSLVNVIPKAEYMSERTAAWLLALKEFSEKANELIQGSLTNTFASLGDAIGNAMAQGTNIFTAAGKAILMGVGNFLSDLGKMMIKYGVAALAYSAASKALLNPLTAAPAAGALIAAGLVLSTVGSAISSAVSSGGTSSSTDYSSSGTSSSYGSSTSYASSSGTSGGTYVFEIAGTKLIGVLKNTLDRNRSLGGSNNLIFST